MTAAEPRFGDDAPEIKLSLELARSSAHAYLLRWTGRYFTVPKTQTTTVELSQGPTPELLTRTTVSPGCYTFEVVRFEDDYLVARLVEDS